MGYIFNYLYNILTLLSQAINTVIFLGDPDESLSGRIGKSYKAGGWAFKVPWPAFMLKHWLASIEPDEGDNSALRRTTRD